MDLRISSRRQKETWLCFLILLTGTVLKLVYAWQVPYNISPHDLRHASDWVNFDGGHLSYIQYLYRFHQLFPENPVTKWQFYHPPLFYSIGALVFQLFYTQGAAVEPIFEIIQYVNTLFACCIAFVGYRILTHLQVCGKKLITLTGFLSFGPSLYWIGTILNNDCLMTLLLAICIEQCVLWIHSPRIGTIIKMALSLALAMLSKTSAVLIAPAIGCVFLYELIRRIRQKERLPGLIAQFAVFALISIPLGTSFVLRNWLLFQTPPNYVPALSENSFQYVGNFTPVQRLGLPSLSQILFVGIHWDTPERHCNIWSQTFFTMSLDEGILHFPNVYAKCLGLLMVLSGAGSVLLLLAGTIRTLCSRMVSLPLKLLLGVGYGVIMFSYVLFAFQYPQICTMNFRYIYNTLILLAAGYGISKCKMSSITQAMLWGHCLLATVLYIFFP